MADHAEPVRKPSQAAPGAPAAAAMSGLGREGDSRLPERARMLNARPAGPQPVQPKSAAAPPAPAGRGGLPGPLKAGIEALSGLAMDDVRVHRDSAEPARLGALAFARGSDIHLAPGQDRHLPHEAWHVVQQKQGRVKPTLQRKGAGINDDRGLEREADLMGARALAGAAGPAASASAVPAARPGVIQARLIRGGQDVTIAWYQWGSDVAKRYIAAPQTWVLRDDSSVTSNAIHVLPADQKYLLGEVHGDGTWAARTRNWSIDTMHEGGKAIPEAVAPAQGRGQALESTHAYAMQAAIAAQTMLHPINKLWTAIEANRIPQLIQAGLVGLPNLLAQGKKWLVELLHVGDSYNAFSVANLARDGEPAVALVRTFSADFEAAWRAELVGMRDAIDNISARGALALDATARPQYDIIHAGRPTLETMVTRLLALMAAPATADLGRIAALSQRAPAGDPLAADYLTAGNPHREAAMIANVTAARAPLLVQLGNNHVDAVRAAVPNSVAFKVGTNFEAHTRKGP